ncbi:MAG: toxin-antitoxin system antidote component [Algoriphagus marincola HL-49]|uniref:Toxin-antitoxin system antidote component n=1 Tax=Algoriphagus marincola HL-49 TaxID=1305737 RepID=A0A0P8CBF8_9BACT|nr:MAG: toxin-antitoxin system antidote component [Algoriphagus marincola HL-49]
MEKVTISILDKKAFKKLEALAKQKLIEINKGQTSSTVDWEKYVGSVKKLPLSEIEKDIKEFRNWE